MNQLKMNENKAILYSHLMGRRRTQNLGQEDGQGHRTDTKQRHEVEIANRTRGREDTNTTEIKSRLKRIDRTEKTDTQTRHGAEIQEKIAYTQDTDTAERHRTNRTQAKRGTSAFIIAAV